jgi:aminoglycoside 3-N-acetyltransferase
MPHTVTTLAEDVRKMGFRKGDALMVHSSMKSIGKTEGGPDAVIDALFSVIDPKTGVMFVPTLTGTFATASWDEMRKYAFDASQTPSRVGLITETFRRRPEAFRSRHPTHSLAAIGKNAKELVRYHAIYSTTFDKHGPYGKYIGLNATIMFIGTGMGCNTSLHVAEDWADLPYMDNLSRARVKTKTGEIEAPVKMSPNGHRSFYTSDANSPAVQLLYSLKLVREGKLGDAKVQLVRAQDVINTMMKTYYRDDPAFLLCRKDDCEFCRKGREACEQAHPRIKETIEQLCEDGWCAID